ncbi:hypothetical protein ACHAXS_003540 [Conticribra weissflogii]
MSRQITQPVNQVRLTNVAVVRLSRGGNRFEVACYRNKIVNYRQGTETDLSEVLQTTRVFTNVSKGQFAKSSLLEKCFGMHDEEEVCRLILEKGDVQVSDLERNAQLESTIREVASMVSEKCVHPVSQRPYTMAQIRDAMKMAGFMVHPTRNTKQQFLDCVRLLQKTEVLSIERAKMQLALVFISSGDGNDENYVMRRNAAIEMLLEAGVNENDIQAPTTANSNRIVFLSDPSLYRQVDAIAREVSVKGRVEIIQQCVTEEGDVALGSELERRALQQQQQHHISGHAANADQSMKRDVNSLDDGDEQLSSELQTRLNLKESTDDHTNDIQSPESRAANSRKAQKAAQKKSKKAKRREKEEQVERDNRISAEKTRQRERAGRLGLTDNDGDNGATAIGKSEDANATGGDAKPCNTCGGAFTPGEYRSHFRSDWHRYNVKLKMKGVPPVSEKEFLLCDSDAFFD